VSNLFEEQIACVRVSVRVRVIMNVRTIMNVCVRMSVRERVRRKRERTFASHEHLEVVVADRGSPFSSVPFQDRFP